MPSAPQALPPRLLWERIRGRPRRLLTLLGLLLCLASPVGLQANVAPPTQPGQVTGLLIPGAGLEVELMRHILHVDLSASPNSGAVEATYQLQARLSPSQSLFFYLLLQGPSALLPEQVQVRWGNQPVPLRAAPPLTSVEEEHIRRYWPQMESVVDPVTGARRTSPSPGVPSIRSIFLLSLPKSADRGILTLRYTQAAALEQAGYVYPIYHYQYLLQSARAWGAMERLDVEVILPPGRHFFASSIPMEREGASYLVSYAGLPPENLAFSIMNGEWLMEGQLTARPYQLLHAGLVALLGCAGAALLIWLPTLVKSPRGQLLALGVGAAICLVSMPLLADLLQLAVPPLVLRGGMQGVAMLEGLLAAVLASGAGFGARWWRRRQTQRRALAEASLEAYLEQLPRQRGPV